VPLPRRADLKTGYDCNSNCVFCVIGDKLFTGNRSTQECIAELVESRKTCEDVVFTGAEVTIRPDVFVLIEAARRLGYRNIQIQTNGRMLAYRAFCEKAIAAGANEFSPSIHGHIAKLHDGLTRAPGSFAQITQAIRNLKELGQRVITNTVITKQNARHLPALARMLVDLGVDQYQLAFPHPTGHLEQYFFGVVPRMSEIFAHVHAALEVGIAVGVACMAEAMPYCQLPGYERYAAEIFIPPTEIVYDGFVVPDYRHDRMERGKTRFVQCASCRFEPMCEGPWREYPAQLGDGEFQPVAGPRVLDTAILADDRFGLLGTPAPPIDGLTPAGRLRLADLDAPWVAVAFYPEDGSPACTAEARSLQGGLAELRQAGIVVVGVSRDGVDRHHAFACAHGLTFPLVADADGAIARAYQAAGGATRGEGSAPRRSTYLLGPERRIDHVLVAVDPGNHAAEILSAVRRFAAAPRSLAPGPELIVLRRRARPAAEVARELGLRSADLSQFGD
jgi:peroxiredoxin/MoaA/NifB/PqqE/SkfB family radical SAM enzyme